MKVYKSAILSTVFILLLLSFIFSTTSNYTFSTTGNVSLNTKMTVFSLSITALILTAILGTLQMPQQIGKNEKSEKYQKSEEDVKSIKSILEYYGRKKKIDFGKIQREILDYVRDLRENHNDYLDTLGSLGTYIVSLAESSNVSSHGHFLKGRGKDYIEGMFRELGLYHLLKGKV